MRAINEQTGEVVELQNGQWVTVTPPTQQPIPEGFTQQQPGIKEQMSQVLQNLRQLFPINEQDPISKATAGVITSQGPGNPLLEEALQGATFGFSDELQRALSGQPEMADLIRAQQASFRQQNPKTAIAANIAGGLSTGLGIGNVLKGTDLGKTIANIAVTKPKTLASITGGVTGAATGAGTAPTIEDMPKEMLTGGLVGATLAPALLYGGEVAKRAVIDPTRRLLSNFTQLTPKNIATNQLVKSLEQDGVNAEEIAKKLTELGPDARLVDVAGPNTRQLAQTAINAPGKARALAEKELTERSNRSVARMVGDAKRLLGTDKSLFKATENLIKTRSKEAAPLYAELRGQRPLLTGDFAKTMEKPDLKAAFNVGVRKALNDGVKLPKRLEEGGVIPFEVVDYTKRALDDKIGVAVRAGKKDTARQLLSLKSELTDFADQSFPGYADARKVFSDHTAMLNASEMGKNILKSDAEEMTALVTNMPESEKKMFVIGAMKAVTDKLKMTAEGSDAGKRFSTQLLKERIRPAFPDNQTYQNFIQGLEREKIFMQSKGILGGSPTATRLTSEAVTAEDVAIDAATGNFLNTALNGVRTFLRGNKRIPEPVRDEIGELMFSSIARGKPLSNEVVAKLKRYQVSQKAIDDLMVKIRIGVGISSGEIYGQQH